ncbi:MAG TPA: hypothetical protein VGE34_03070 [Candidatus Saccharimonadales bacterium]
MSESADNTHTHEPKNQEVAKPAEKPVSPIKKYFLYVLVGGLVASALISIVSILAGEFSDTSTKALWTTISIVFHSLLGLAFLSADQSPRRDTSLIVNTVFGVVIASLATSIFGIWEIVDGVIIGDLYQVYFMALIANLVIAALLNTSMQDKVVRYLTWSTIGAIATMFIALLPWIFQDNYYDLPDVYFRILAALAIVLATLAVLTTIFDRLYQMKHPRPKQPLDGGASMTVKIIVIIIAVIVGAPVALGMLFSIFGMLLY